MRIFLDRNSDQVRQQVEKVEKLVMDGESLLAGDNLVDALKGSPPHSEASAVGWGTQSVDDLIIENPQLLLKSRRRGRRRPGQG